MATNPMQRKSRNSFILGALITLLIMGAIVGFLVYQISKMKQEEEARLSSLVSIYTLNQDVSSGQILTEDMFSMIKVERNTVPSTATSSARTISNYFLQDQNGNSIITRNEDGVSKNYVVINNQGYVINTDESNKDYIQYNNERRYVEYSEVPLIAKIDLKKNTVITPDMFGKSDEQITNDLREQEYNMLILSSELVSEDFVDIRLRLPSGADYIVLSKKRVEIPNVGGQDSDTMIRLKLSEDEILTMSSAIVENYMVEGSKLYTVKYVEPGMQETATPTYVARQEIINLITQNPNIVDTARQAIYNRFTNDTTGTRNSINGEVAKTEEEQRNSNIQSKVQEEVQAAQDARKAYLESLSSGSMNY